MLNSPSNWNVHGCNVCANFSYEPNNKSLLLARLPKNCPNDPTLPLINGMVPPRRANFSDMETSANKSFENVLSGSWNVKEGSAFMEAFGVAPKIRNEVVECANNAHIASLKDQIYETDRHQYNELIEEMKNFQKSLESHQHIQHGALPTLSKCLLMHLCTTWIWAAQEALTPLT